MKARQVSFIVIVEDDVDDDDLLNTVATSVLSYVDLYEGTGGLWVGARIPYWVKFLDVSDPPEYQEESNRLDIENQSRTK